MSAYHEIIQTINIINHAEIAPEHTLFEDSARQGQALKKYIFSKAKNMGALVTSRFLERHLFFQCRKPLFMEMFRNPALVLFSQTGILPRLVQNHPQRLRRARRLLFFISNNKRFINQKFSIDEFCRQSWGWWGGFYYFHIYYRKI